MAYLWTLTLGLVISLGILGGVFIHAVRSGLNVDDSTSIDPLEQAVNNEIGH